MAEATTDNSGFIEIRDNRLSKPGVFDYLGSEIGAPEPDKVYKVCRPKEELADPDCVASFKLQPWVIGHKMLGKKFETPPEEHGIHGVIGENVYFDESDGWLKGNIKMFTDELESEITNGIDELSLGFSCTYEFGKTGTYDGVAYNVVQRNIRGNHLASVEESRMDVAVMDSATAMDHLTVTLNPTGVTIVDKKTVKDDDKAKDGTGQDADMTMSEMMAALKELMPMMKAMQEMMAMANGNMNMDGDYNMDTDPMKKDAMDEDKEEGMDEDKEEGMDEDKEDNGMDQKAVTAAVAAAVKPLADEIRTLKQQQAGMDSGTLLQEISKRDELAAQLSHHIGTFDHASKTLAEVAAYGVEKLEIPCEKGTEVAAIGAYLHNRKRPTDALYTTKTTGQDGKPVASPVDAYINGSAE